MKANPAGILMIGLGVVFLNLAYTGRGKAVWDALSGSGSGASSGATDKEKTAQDVPQGTGQGGDATEPGGHLWRVFRDEIGTTWGTVNAW